MRYSNRQYARALLGIIESEERPLYRKKALRRFLTILFKHRRLSKLDLIIREVEKEYLRGAGLKKISVETAEELEDTFRNEIKEILGEGALIFEKINPHILAGIRILINDEFLIDASGRTLVNKLFSI